MNVRGQVKRRMRERVRHHVYAGGYKLRRGRRYTFQAVLPDGRVLLSGWFVADSSNPVVRVLG